MNVQLPLEVLVHVARLTSDSPTLNSLAQVSTSFNEAITPILYNSVKLFTTAQLSNFYQSITPVETPSRSYIDSQTAIKKRLGYIKHLEILITTNLGSDAFLREECASVRVRPELSALMLNTIRVTASGPLVEEITIPIPENRPTTWLELGRPTEIHASNAPLKGDSTGTEVRPVEGFTTVTSFRYDFVYMVHALCLLNPPVHMLFYDTDYATPETMIVSTDVSGTSPGRRLGFIFPSEQHPRSRLLRQLTEESGSSESDQIAHSRILSVEFVDCWYPPMWTTLSPPTLLNSSSSMMSDLQMMSSSSSDFDGPVDVKRNKNSHDPDLDVDGNRISKAPVFVLAGQEALTDDQFEPFIVFSALNVYRSASPPDADEEDSFITIHIRCRDQAGRDMLKRRQEDETLRILDDFGRRIRLVEHGDGETPVNAAKWQEEAMEMSRKIRRGEKVT